MSVRLSVRLSVRGFQPLYWKVSLNSFPTWCIYLLGECPELIQFWAMLDRFQLSGGQKMTENVGLRWFPTISWKTNHSIHFSLCVYTCWLSIQNWFAIGPCWPNFGLLVAKKLLKMVVSYRYLENQSWSISNLVYTLVGLVLRIDSQCRWRTFMVCQMGFMYSIWIGKSPIRHLVLATRNIRCVWCFSPTLY